MTAFDRFCRDVRMLVAMTRNGWAIRAQAQQKLGREALAIVTLQMFHHASRLLPLIERARDRLPPALEYSPHEEYRELLDYLSAIEKGRELVALMDLARMGYDARRCRETLPLPPTYNLFAATRSGIDELGPYVFLGFAYACETVLDDIRLRFHEIYAEDPELCGCIGFYRILGGSGMERVERTEACFKKYVETQELYEPLLMGYLGAVRNLLLIGNELQYFKAYPRSFDLPQVTAVPDKIALLSPAAVDPELTRGRTDPFT